MKFSYTAASKLGKISAGTLEASSHKSAVAQLERNQLVVVRCKAARRGGLLSRFNQVPLLQRMFIAQHLSTMLRAGVSLLEALRVIREEMSNRRLKKILHQVSEKVSGGTSLAAALEAQGQAFDQFFINLVRVGESSGTLEENLTYLAEELDKRISLRSKIRTAATYPVVVIIVTVVLGVILTYFVLPNIVPLFTSLKIKLPWTTMVLMAVAGFVRGSGLLSLYVGIAIVVAVRMVFYVPPIRQAWHRSLLSLPVVGRTVRSISLANFCRTLGTLLKSGVPVVEALDIAAETTRNLAYRDELARLREAVRSGQSLAAGIAVHSKRVFFPTIMLSLIRVGESSGKLDESLLYLNQYYEREVDNLMKNVAVILEPALLVFIGLVVAFVAGSIITPIYQISGSLKVR